MNFPEKFLSIGSDYFRRLPGFSLFCTNLLLAALLLLFRDPLGWFGNSYGNSDPIFDMEKEEVYAIVCGRKGQESRMERDANGWIVRLGPDFSAPGDSPRIEGLLNGAISLRRFTLIQGSENSGTSDHFGLSGDEPVLEIFDRLGNSKGKILIGTNPPRSSGTYIMDDENRIWLVKENLKSLTGSGKRDFFLSRSLIPKFPAIETIREIAVRSKTRSEEFRLQQVSPGEWNLEYSGRILSASATEVESFLSILDSLKADEVLLEKTETSLPIPQKQDFEIEIRTETERISARPYGMTKWGSYLIRNRDLPYPLVFDTWNLERILQKDISDFLVPSSPTRKGF